MVSAFASAKVFLQVLQYRTNCDDLLYILCFQGERGGGGESSTTTTVPVTQPTKVKPTTPGKYS